MKLLAYIIKKCLGSIAVFVGVSLLIFTLFNVVGGDPAYVILGKNPSVEQVSLLRETLGLNDSITVQYLNTLKSFVTFDLGRSWSTKKSISSLIKTGIIPSLSITIPSFFFSTFFGLALAFLVVIYRGRPIDKFILLISTCFMSVSSLVYILIGQWFFAYKLGWFEISGFEMGFPHFIPYIILPVILWVILTVGIDIRFFRTVLLEEYYKDHILTARAKGLSIFSILFKHVLKNAMIPILTYIISYFPFLILGTILLESFFSIPGIGSLIIDSLNAGDFPVLKAISLLISIFVIFANLSIDIGYAVFDPRLRGKIEL